MSLEQAVLSKKSAAYAYVLKQEFSLQKAVYHLKPKTCLRKFFPVFVVANSNNTEKRNRIMLSKK